MYSYTNTNWKDQLTNYNGKAITYDAIGNPLTYDGNTYTWQNGRQLQKIVNTSKNQEIVYQYNEDGIRTRKMVNGVATKYFIEGSKVIYEKTNDVTTYYTYDEQGRVIGLNRAGRQYYYIRNAQEDIIGLLDSSLNLVANYTYDSWGNVISVTDVNGKAITDANHIGKLNPFRYKGYYYDTDTGLYYLQSRYYNPEWGRFLNADSILDTQQGLIGTNMYAYCANNPVNNIDSDGQFFISITTLIVAVIVVAIIATIPQDTWVATGEAVGTGIESVINIGKTIVSSISNNSKESRKSSTSNSNKNTTTSNKKSRTSSKTGTSNKIPQIQKPEFKYPTDVAKPPAPGFEWRGKGTPQDGKGNWFNPKTGESLRPDLNHPKPIPPHWDYQPGRQQPGYRWFPDGSMQPK